MLGEAATHCQAVAVAPSHHWTLKAPRVLFSPHPFSHILPSNSSHQTHPSVFLKQPAQKSEENTGMGKGKASQGRLPTAEVGQKTTSAAEKLAHHLPLRTSMGLVGLQAEESAVWCAPATRSLTAPPGKSIRQIRASLRPPVRPHHARPPLLAYRMKFHNTRVKISVSGWS